MTPLPASVADASGRVQTLLRSLERVQAPEAAEIARELVAAVLALHGAGLRELLNLVKDAGNQPADVLPPRFAANPAVASLLLLHDLHPDDLATRARRIADHLRPRLGVRGVHAELVDVRDGTIRIAVTPSGEHVRRPDAHALHTMIETAVCEQAPDAELVIEGLAATAGAIAAPAPTPATERRRSQTTV